MANYCRFCGKNLVDGKCDCKGFQNDMAYNTQQKVKEPFLIPHFHLDFKSFSGFMTSLRNQSGIGENFSDSKDPFEYNIPIVPNCIDAEENEVVVKQYNIAKLRTRLKGMKAEGRLQVTNRRILFRAAGTSLTGNILQEHQFNLDEIGGVEIHKDYKFSILSFLGCLFLDWILIYVISTIFSRTGNGGTVAIGLILGIMGIAPTFIVYKHFWFKLMCAMLASGAFSMSVAASNGNGFMSFLLIIANAIALIDLIIVCFVPNLVLKIKTKSATGAVVIGSQKSMFRRKTGDDYAGFAEVMPWEDTVMAMNELGTMIDDLQKHGDYAIEKWTK